MIIGHRCIDDHCQTLICLLKMLIWGFDLVSKGICDASIKRNFEIDVIIEDDVSNNYELNADG